MKDRFSIWPIDKLLKILLNQYEHKGSILGISKKLFFHPERTGSISISHFGEELESPIGVAAGPHTQLAQNIVMSWLTGARFIELKTVQTLDELDVSKPCIDMQDEGYNCEWSQELKIRESFDQYLDAWIIIHILRHKLFGLNKGHPGFSFNMSVGYDLKGIMQDNVQWYLDQMSETKDALLAKLDKIRDIYPEVDEIEIASTLSRHITLSTMHGCPPEEIGKIAEYLLSKRKLHTAIKLNPTLLGPEAIHSILSGSGFDTQVPNLAFEHDLKYEDALPMIRQLRQTARESDVEFGLKLTNTLESRNHKSNFPDQEMMYMSGRALHPISVNLAAKLQTVFNGELNLSFSGGANADNIAELYRCGLAPVTVCTDLLKPGGYGRLNQYIDTLKKCEAPGDTAEQLKNLQVYAKKVQTNDAYKRTRISDIQAKTQRPLGYFDCIQAPCVDTCPTHQNIPEYLNHTARGEYVKAYQTIRETNPFPLTTGMICDHLCQNKCVRIHYDSPVKIRDVKRFIAEYARDHKLEERTAKSLTRAQKVAIIGAGPSGLSCAYYLAKNGVEVDLFESQQNPGGMISHAIPSFRLTGEAIELDIQKIREMGVKIHFGTTIDAKTFQAFRKKYEAVFIGAGAQRSVNLHTPGVDTNGVLDPLSFLFDVKSGKRPRLGKQVVIIGGGNTAMDAARTAMRLVDKGGKVTIVYRRTVRQMPADQGEIKAVLEEGVEMLELHNPIKILSENGYIRAIRCQKMRLGPTDSSGRAKPIPLENEFVEIPVDCLIPAIGQEKAFDFLPSDHLVEGTYETSLPGVFIGGDARRGASTAINAIGDGRKAAMEMLGKMGIPSDGSGEASKAKSDPETLMIRKTRRVPPISNPEPNNKEKYDFEVIDPGLTEEEAIYEAKRCLSCDEICNLCVTVCPNLAFHPYRIKSKPYQIQELVFAKESTEIQNTGVFQLDQEHQILHIADWCNACGNCNTFCPTAEAPYKNKAHLYLNRSEFEQEKDGFYTYFEQDHPVIQAYFEQDLYTLKKQTDNYLFLFNEAELILSPDDLKICEMVRFQKNTKINTEKAAIMAIILEGAMDFLQMNLS